jgi:hypothetical protein
MAVACISFCSNTTGPIAIITKTSLSNTTIIMITITTVTAVHRSPNTIHWIGSNTLKRSDNVLSNLVKVTTGVIGMRFILFYWIACSTVPPFDMNLHVPMTS